MFLIIVAFLPSWPNSIYAGTIISLFYSSSDNIWKTQSFILPRPTTRKNFIICHTVCGSDGVLLKIRNERYKLWEFLCYRLDHGNTRVSKTMLKDISSFRFNKIMKNLWIKLKYLNKRFIEKISKDKTLKALKDC